VFYTSVPCTTNAIASKGVGELGTIGGTPVVVNAVIDALDHAGQGRAASVCRCRCGPSVCGVPCHDQYDPPPLQV